MVDGLVPAAMDHAIRRDDRGSRPGLAAPDAPLAVRLLLQRVTRAAVRVDDAVVGSIGDGLLVLVGVGHDDTLDIGSTHGRPDGRACASSGTTTDAPTGPWSDVGGALLAVSQFTLYADTRKGRRPSFLDAAPPDLGDELYRAYADAVASARASASSAASSAPRWRWSWSTTVRSPSGSTRPHEPSTAMTLADRLRNRTDSDPAAPLADTGPGTAPSGTSSIGGTPRSGTTLIRRTLDRHPAHLLRAGVEHLPAWGDPHRAGGRGFRAAGGRAAPDAGRRAHRRAPSSTPSRRATAEPVVGAAGPRRHPSTCATSTGSWSGSRRPASCTSCVTAGTWCARCASTPTGAGSMAPWVKEHQPLSRSSSTRSAGWRTPRRAWRIGATRATSRSATRTWWPDPAAVLSSLLESLGEAFDPGLLVDPDVAHESGERHHAGTAISTGSMGRWRTDLTLDEQATVGSIVGATARRGWAIRATEALGRATAERQEGQEVLRRVRRQRVQTRARDADAGLVVQLERLQVDLVPTVRANAVHAHGLGVEATHRGLAAEVTGAGHAVIDPCLVVRGCSTAGPGGRFGRVLYQTPTPGRSRGEDELERRAVTPSATVAAAARAGVGRDRPLRAAHRAGAACREPPRSAARAAGWASEPYATCCSRCRDAGSRPVAIGRCARSGLWSGARSSPPGCSWSHCRAGPIGPRRLYRTIARLADEDGDVIEAVWFGRQFIERRIGPPGTWILVAGKVGIDDRGTGDLQNPDFEPEGAVDERDARRACCRCTG